MIYSQAFLQARNIFNSSSQHNKQNHEKDYDYIFFSFFIFFLEVDAEKMKEGLYIQLTAATI